MVVVLPVPLTPTMRTTAGPPAIAERGLQARSRGDEQRGELGPDGRLRRRPGRAAWRARSTRSMARAAPTSPAMSVSSTSSHDGPSPVPVPRKPRSRDMKLPRVRSRPASRAASGVGGAAQAVGRPLRRVRPSSAAARCDRRRGAGIVDRSATDGGSASNGSSGSVVGIGSTGVPSSRSPKSAGSGSQSGSTSAGSTGSSTSGVGRFVAAASPEGHRRSLPRRGRLAPIARGERLRLVESQADDRG